MKCIYLKSTFVFVNKMKTGFSLIDSDVIFPIQSSAFIKALKFGSNLKKKNCKKNRTFFILTKENLNFIDELFFLLLTRFVNQDLQSDA